MFYLTSKVTAVACGEMNNETVKTLWHRFSILKSELEIVPCDSFSFAIGKMPLPALEEGKEYALCIDERGAAVVGRDFNSLMRGYFALLMKMLSTKIDVYMEDCAEQSGYTVANRMMHICVFPENDFYFIQKLIRLCGLCQYTHIVIEFWGMLQFDCLKELAWPNALTKAQAKQLIEEARAFGMEPIPMFNMLGHATACRVSYGKHVVLDQNPTLQYLFTPDGWAWDIHSEEVLDLFRAVRKELYELFGEGEYIHIGCDEAYFYAHCEAERKQLPAFLKALTDEVAAEGRRPMVWMDMMLDHNKVYKNCTPEEAEVMRAALNEKTVMVDWEYRLTEVPLGSLASLQGNRCDAMGAPWYNPENYAAHVRTVEQCNLFGVMMTAWHTLNEEMRSILGCAKEMGTKTFPWSEFSGLREETATLMRCISFEGNSYEDCGWIKKQIEI